MNSDLWRQILARSISVRAALAFFAAWGALPTAAQPNEMSGATIAAVLERSWDHKLISSGDNFPGLNLYDEHRGDLLVLLHEGVSPEAIRRHFGWDETVWARRIAELIAEGMAREDAGGRVRPGVMVMTASSVADHLPVSADLVAAAAALVEEFEASHDAWPLGLSPSEGVRWEAASLLLLSDVLLDNWQIRRVERDVLGAERPLRGTSRYYYAIQEHAHPDSVEAFGIYGNQVRQYGPYTVGVYGNRRQQVPQIHTLSAERRAALFGRGVTTEAILDTLVHAVEVGQALPASMQSGFDALGWQVGPAPTVVMLSPSDAEAFSELASAFAPDWIALLRSNLGALRTAYAASPYAEEVTFEEYFMWWYHLFYTAVTERLVRGGVITSPGAGVMTYIKRPTP